MGIADKQGLPPGSYTYAGKSKPLETSVTITRYNADTLQQTELHSLDDLKNLPNDGHEKVWINIVGVQNIDLIAGICDHFQVHPLVIEDLFNMYQRSKVEFFDNYLFLVCKLRGTNPASGGLRLSQMSMLLFENCLITIQEKPFSIFNGVAKRLQMTHSRMRTRGSDYMAYALLDVVVDDYLAFIERCGESIENYENQIIDSKQNFPVKKIYAIRRTLIRLRKVIQPLRDMVSMLLKTDTNIIQKPSLVYLRDLFDHSVSLLENIDTLREMSSSLLEMYLSILNNRMNETMKVLTIFASIFIPLTFIAGIYGMNFTYMPELKWHYGYYGLLGVMGLVAVLMLVIFKIKKWF